MALQEIPRNRWVQFLDHFSRLHDSWLVNVELRRADGSSELMAEKLELLGVTADDLAGGDDTISIVIGKTPEESLTHIISRPARLLVDREETAADRLLQIETTDGDMIVLSFVSPVAAETVDGILVH